MSYDTFIILFGVVVFIGMILTFIVIIQHILTRISDIQGAQNKMAIDITILENFMEDIKDELKYNETKKANKFMGKDGLYSYEAYNKNIKLEDDGAESEAMRKAFDELED